ncbi:MAG TPA: hypothetical protein VGD62_02515 [Acidobacteriaceae bacterium]
MRILKRVLLATALCLPAAALAQVSYTPMPLDKGFGELDPSQPTLPVAEILTRFEARESECRRALASYTYERTVKVETVDDDGKVDGQYTEVVDITADPNGKLYERVVHAPANTIQRVMMTPADFDDIEHRLPFVLTTEDAGQYDLTYLGKQKVDEVNTYVFTVKPKVLEKGKRYFEGRIWVDQKELQIVVTSGKNVPDDLRRGHEDLSTPFMTYRAQVDGKYWFPVYTHGDGVLHFPAGKGYLGEEVHMRQTIKYTDYKKFGSSIRITYDGQDVERDQSAPAQKPH